MAGSLRIYGSSSGYVELAAPATAGNTVLTLPTDSIQSGLVLVNKTDFSAASTVSVNNCFSNQYSNYRIIISYSANTLNTYPQLRLRASGVDSSSATYSYGLGEQQYGAGITSRTYEINGTYWRVGWAGTANTYSNSVIDITNPQVAEWTYFNAAGGGNDRVIFGGGVFSSITQFDGFTLYMSSGTFTGTLRVYGYRNS